MTVNRRSETAGLIVLGTTLVVAAVLYLVLSPIVALVSWVGMDALTGGLRVFVTLVLVGVVLAGLALDAASDDETAD